MGTRFSFWTFLPSPPPRGRLAFSFRECILRFPPRCLSGKFLGWVAGPSSIVSEALGDSEEPRAGAAVAAGLLSLQPGLGLAEAARAPPFSLQAWLMAGAPSWGCRWRGANRAGGSHVLGERVPKVGGGVPGGSLAGTPSPREEPSISLTFPSPHHSLRHPPPGGPQHLCHLSPTQPSFLGCPSPWGPHALNLLSPPPAFYQENIQTHRRVGRILQRTPQTHHLGSVMNTWLYWIRQVSVQPPCVHRSIVVWVIPEVSDCCAFHPLTLSQAYPASEFQVRPLCWG